MLLKAERSSHEAEIALMSPVSKVISEVSSLAFFFLVISFLIEEWRDRSSILKHESHLGST